MIKPPSQAPFVAVLYSLAPARLARWVHLPIADDYNSTFPRSRFTALVAFSLNQTPFFRPQKFDSICH
jgi:hypothetical protein